MVWTLFGKRLDTDVLEAPAVNPGFSAEFFGHEEKPMHPTASVGL